MARRIVVAPYRSGGQAQFVQRALPAAVDHPLDETRAWMQAHLAEQLLLEETDLGVDRIATECGFGSAVSLRVHFRRELRVSPLAYRRAFRAARSA